MSLKDFNINDTVYVKLTNFGKQILKDQHDELNKFGKEVLGEFKPLAEDADGWSKWQLWILMERFGSKFNIGGPLPFETTIKVEID